MSHPDPEALVDALALCADVAAFAARRMERGELLWEKTHAALLAAGPRSLDEAQAVILDELGIDVALLPEELHARVFPELPCRLTAAVVEERFLGSCPCGYASGDHADPEGAS